MDNAPTAFFFGTTSGTAPSFTSGSSATFTAGTVGSFPVTTSGTPAVNSITNASNGSCTISSYPTGVAFNYTTGASTASITSTTASPAGSYTFCLTASNGVNPNATQTFTLIILGPAAKLVLTAQTTTPTAGAGDNLTITAEDSGGNTVPTYTGTKNLTFSGANLAPNGTTHPTVTNSSGTAVIFGTATPITFLNGVAQVSGSNNGVMTLFKAETASIKVSDGTITNGTGLSVSVAAASAAGLSFANASTKGGAATVTCTGTVGSTGYACTLSTSNGSGNGRFITANVTLIDQYQNLVNNGGSSLSVALASNGTLSPTSVTITSGSSTSSTSFTDTLPSGSSSATVTASATVNSTSVQAKVTA